MQRNTILRIASGGDELRKMSVLLGAFSAQAELAVTARGEERAQYLAQQGLNEGAQRAQARILAFAT
eukprot:8957244-Lingulodinium_polyedra.AAC.1